MRRSKDEYSQTEVIIIVFIYFVVGLGVFEAGSFSSWWLDIVLCFAYVAFGVFLASTIIRDQPIAVNTFDRSYYFSKRYYDISGFTLRLFSLPQSASLRSRRFSDRALSDGLLELFAQSGHLLSPHVQKYRQASLCIESDGDVLFDLEECLRYPYTSIDLTYLHLSQPAPFLSDHGNCCLQILTLPKSAKTVNLYLCDVPSLKAIVIPSDSVVHLTPSCLKESNVIISGASSNLVFYVPEELLEAYRSDPLWSKSVYTDTNKTRFRIVFSPLNK